MAATRTNKTTAAKARPTAVTPSPAADRHRLVKLRRATAGCSCGASYATEAPDREEATADLRGQHREHKLNPVPAKPVRKPRARKATAK